MTNETPRNPIGFVHTGVQNPATIVIARDGLVVEKPFRDGMTVRDALQEVGIENAALENVRVNNEPITALTDFIKPDDQISALGAIQGAN